MTDESETVFVAGRRRGGPKRKIHTDEDCPALKQARTVIERRADVYPHQVDFCEFCTSDVEQPDTQDVSDYKALVEAAEAEAERGEGP